MTRATAAGKHVAALETEPATVNASNLRLAKIATRCVADANGARTDLRDAHARLVEVEREAKSAREDLYKVREQSTELAKATGELLCQMTKVSSRAQSLETEVMSLKSQMIEVLKVRDDAISSANEKCRDARMLGSCISLSKDKLCLLRQKELTG